MQSFEWLHPILTPTFKLDWLSNFKIKDVNLLQKQSNYQTSIEQSMDYVNATMQKIMQTENLVWGIQKRKNNQLVGIIKISNLNKKTTFIEFINDSLSQIEQEQILERISPLLKQLGCKNFEVIK
ncbi:hypothetical protein [Apilactobacillus ozensis]|uniref:hypothetical protein n=1 Tax=Apilactobacillus ozensis TaxID=866801 RepID=UPI00200B37A7|nr:hypothetical protein [Apilactobacillus ozensis]MCK8606748.1 hypothetical protein [Apilactobacillus ozensis]